MRYVKPDKSHSKKAMGFNKHAEYSRCESLGREKDHYVKAKEWFTRTPYSMRSVRNA